MGSIGWLLGARSIEDPVEVYVVVVWGGVEDWEVLCEGRDWDGLGTHS